MSLHLSVLPRVASPSIFCSSPVYSGYYVFATKSLKANRCFSASSTRLSPKKAQDKLKSLHQQRQAAASLEIDSNDLFDDQPLPIKSDFSEVDKQQLLPIWDEDAASEAFFSGARPLLATKSQFVITGQTSPHLLSLSYPIDGFNGFYYRQAREFFNQLEESQRMEGIEFMKKKTEEAKKIQRQKDVEKNSQQVYMVNSKSRFDSAEEFAKYQDEYSKIFNSFVPFHPPDEAADVFETFSQEKFTSISANTEVQLGSNSSRDEDFLEFLLLSNRQQFPKSPVPPPPISIDDFEEYFRSLTLSKSIAKDISKKKTTDEIEEGVQAISIIKRRRKKMNKHKWKKRRREVRKTVRFQRKNKKDKDNDENDKKP
ncbi:hypothetical protein HK096_004936 [Nowakowskiella sp. JEL0078]|nr:hypothetical protein HK096_004936 [Nowakowskiella sp. JEL0078]